MEREEQMETTFALHSVVSTGNKLVKSTMLASALRPCCREYLRSCAVSSDQSFTSTYAWWTFNCRRSCTTLEAFSEEVINHCYALLVLFIELVEFAFRYGYFSSD